MEKESQWSESLKTLLSDKGFKISVYNRSVSGETTGGGLTRISRILDELKPTFLLLELGGNDALRGYPPKNIYENLNKMIEASEKRGVEVFLMQIRILPNYGKRYQTQFESIYPTLSQENDVILLPFMKLPGYPLDVNTTFNAISSCHLRLRCFKPPSIVAKIAVRKSDFNLGNIT